MAKTRKTQKTSPKKSRTSKSTTDRKSIKKKVAEKEVLWLKGLIDGAAGLGPKITRSKTGSGN